MSISIIIPAYNEELLISSTIEAIRQHLIENFNDGEIIIINDGSTDHTQLAIETMIANNSTKISLKLLNNANNRGKGFSVRRGMLASSGNVCVFIDADLPFKLDVLQEMQTRIFNDFDIVIGDRNNPGSKLVYVHLIRKTAGRIYSSIVQLVISDGITDTQCGLKGFSAESAKCIFSKTRINGFGFDVEVLRIAQKHALSISKIPVEMINNRLDSRVHLIRDSILMFWNLVLIKANEWFGYYD
ncbi:MAG: glycosyltransferase [Pelolinea sp.]|nr:glycosyltransferase [Pelolinea sp.]